MSDQECVKCGVKIGGGWKYNLCTRCLEAALAASEQRVLELEAFIARPEWCAGVKAERAALAAQVTALTKTLAGIKALAEASFDKVQCIHRLNKIAELIG